MPLPPMPSLTLTRRGVLAGALASLTPGLLRAQDDPVAPLVAQVSTDRLRATVEALAAFPTRYTPHPDFPAVEHWVATAFRDIGVGPRALAYHPFELEPGLIRHNILAGDPADPRGVILLGAHMDSLSEDPMRLAPGANDNATGVAAMIEAHRILAAADLPIGIASAAFAAEEQDYAGAAALAGLFRAKGWPLGLMVNLDMLGRTGPEPGAPFWIEADEGNLRAENDAAAQAAGEIAALMAARHTDFTIARSDIWNSDYMPFEAEGYPAIGFYDGGAVEGDPAYHTTGDTVDGVDFTRLTQATRLTVATVAAIALRAV
ncbi:M28 family metallopeptidase [Roseicyclus persicicus]|uniref:M28 family peptidase n=1 Tax=Roseicyclus persicicus TaxID=2650661 RepID=A0A7X6GW12_9RHOB|nr:M28 family peptidase [Roseibacterium persicicum]NKX43446.1 M28 family peptidase [Roseibacterium persicicum]